MVVYLKTTLATQGFAFCVLFFYFGGFRLDFFFPSSPQVLVTINYSQKNLTQSTCSNSVCCKHVQNIFLYNLLLQNLNPQTNIL